MFRKIFYECIYFTKVGFSFFSSRDPYVSDKTILLIDSEVDYCLLYADALEKQGFKVILAHTLEIAYLKLNAYQPAIILLNLKLSDGSGTEFIEKNKILLEQKQIILMTANSSTELRMTSMKLGVFYIILKPFQQKALNKIVYLATNFSEKNH